MSGKELTFKLVMEADSKSFVTNVKQSEDVTKAVIAVIKEEAEKLKATSAETAKEVGKIVPDDLQKKADQAKNKLDDVSQAAIGLEGKAAQASNKIDGLSSELEEAATHANHAGSEIGNVVPNGTSELADKLTRSLDSATGIIKGAGDNAKTTANNFNDFGNKSHTALDQLKSDLVVAKQNLESFSKTNAAPADIEKAKAQVDQLEKEVQQADQAFNNFQGEVGKANTKLNETDVASDKAKQGISTFKTTISTLGVALAGLGLGLTIKELIATADATQQMAARLRNATTDTSEYNLVQERLLQLANATFRPLSEAQEVYLATSGTMKSLGYSTEQILSVTESLSLSFTHNATRADQAQSAQDALSKSMAKGAVDADAWMSIITGADNVVRDMAESTGRTEEEIRKLGASGKASISELTQALIQARDRNKELADGMENSTADAMQKTRNNITALIGKMNEQYDISSRLSGVILELGGDFEWIEVLFHDVMLAIEELSGSFNEIDPTVFISLKNAVGAAYDVVKDLIKVAYDLGITILDVLNNASTVFSSFSGATTEVTEKITFLERVFQGLSITFGFLSDGLNAIGIVLKLATGNFYSLTSAANSALAAITWGDVSKQFAANADAAMVKAKQWYSEADKDAQEFNSKGVARLKEAARSQDEINSETLTSSKNKLNQLLADQQSELDGIKATEAEKVSAVQAYAEAAIKANGGVMDGVVQAELITKGYIVTIDEAGKVTVASMAEAKKATEENAQATELAKEKAKQAEKEYQDFIKSSADERIRLEKLVEQAKSTGDLNTFNSAKNSLAAIDTREKELNLARQQRNLEVQQGVVATNKLAESSAKAAAEALGINLDASLNKVSDKFKETESNVNTFVSGLKGLGIEGKNAGDVTYEAWLKWLETAKSQAEIDFAKARLKEFGDQGQVSTSQVEQGLIAIKLQAQKLPDDIDPVTEAFKRLGIETKANLKLAAQQALMDYITIRDSGKATAEGVQKAYEKAAQSAAASGDAGVIAATNAANAGRNLEIQIDDTGKASVKAMDEWTKSNDRVRDSAHGIGDGYRNAGRVAREEAKSSEQAWQEAVNAASKQFDAEMKRQGESLSNGIYNYDSYSKDDVLSQLKSKGYSDDEAKKLAGTIWSKAMAADRAAKEEGLGKGGNPAMKALINQEFDAAAAKGLTTQHGTNKINDLLRQMTASNLVSTGPSTKPVDVNSLAPNVNALVPNTTASPTTRTVQNNISINGKTISIPVAEENQSNFNDFLNELEMLKKGM